MGKFSQVAESTFNELQTDAGVLLKDFNPEEPALVNKNIICATTGGINPTCVPTYSDWGEDIDNVPANTKELAHLDGWECTLGFTALNVTPEVIKMSLGAADISGKAIIPRKTLKEGDFADIWWVGDRSDGGMCAVCLKNALSTGGFSLQTTKTAKDRLQCHLKALLLLKILTPYLWNFMFPKVLQRQQNNFKLNRRIL